MVKNMPLPAKANPKEAMKWQEEVKTASDSVIVKIRAGLYLFKRNFIEKRTAQQGFECDLNTWSVYDWNGEYWTTTFATLHDACQAVRESAK